jgi:hypothetical protein
VSRIASEDLGIKLGDLHQFLAALNLKVVDRDKVCVDKSVYEAYRTLATAALIEPSRLSWEEE